MSRVGQRAAAAANSLLVIRCAPWPVMASARVLSRNSPALTVAEA